MSEQKKKTYSKIKEFLNSPEQKVKTEKNLDMVMNMLPMGAAKAIKPVKTAIMPKQPRPIKKDAATEAEKIAKAYKSKADDQLSVLKTKFPESTEKAIRQSKMKDFADTTGAGRLVKVKERVKELTDKDPDLISKLDPQRRKAILKALKESK